MKKRLVIMMLAGVMALNICACGQKSKDSEEATETASEIAAEGDSATKVAEEKVSDRADYVNLEDLDITEYVKLPDYENMEIEVNKTKITDDEIEAYIDENLLEGMIKNRAVKEGDTANIDYVGKKDGEAFQGGTAQGYNLSIGSGTFIPGFEDGLVGVMPGDTIDLDLTFPENYGSQELAGQAVIFTVTVNGIIENEKYSTITEEKMAEMGLEYKNKEEIWEAGKEAVQSSIDENFNASVSNEIQNKISQETEYLKDVPAIYIEEEVQNYKDYLSKMYESYYQMTMDEALEQQGMTMEQFEQQLTEGVEITVKNYLMLEALSRQEGIKLEKEDVLKRADEEAMQYGYATGSEFLDDVGYNSYRMSVISEKVVEVLKNKVKIVVKEVDEEDVMSAASTEESTETESTEE